ncbi:uncharacterized protein UV8b_02892 [Ustilaginoidea virens]|uniref:Ubiquitin-like modifier HUB1 n=2 Tax=Ustilaginoidea virens TaxID=1159556 RepID=A0A8E5MGJ1_USTVR|nr:uncharacterized protein UV8b_02892 [Ustilaginoidea virens]QUC18651.1 hypothetical protein UV8b_02892 [Ustilaginoidea virens]
MAGESSRRSRSRSPASRDSRRSRGGFRWKNTGRRNDERDAPGGRRDVGECSRDRDRRRGLDENYGRRQNTPRDRDGEDSRRGPDRLRSPRRGDRYSGDRGSGKGSTKERPAAAAPAGGGGEEMIIVHVNDRLGSKSAVPCLPSDTIGQFKMMVAARIGREPSQIMLRRQGERPFKDHITLEDYGISNGVQLDLEIDTGD